MRKFFAIILLVFAVAGNTFAMNNMRSGLLLGVGSHSLATSETSGDLKSGLGANVGMVLEFTLDSKFSTSIGLAYNQKKYSASNTTLKFDYLEVPALLNMKLGDSNGAAKPFLQAGLIYGRVTKIKSESGGVEADYPSNTVNEGALTLPFGIGAEFPLNKSLQLSALLSYQVGLNNINKSGSDTAKFNSLCLTIGLHFDTNSFDGPWGTNDPDIEARAREFLYHKKQLKDPNAVLEVDGQQAPLLEQAEGTEEVFEEVPAEVAEEAFEEVPAEVTEEQIDVADERSPTDVVDEVPVETEAIPSEDLPNE